MIPKNTTKAVPVDTYITVGEWLPSERSNREAIEVKLRLQRKNTSRQLRKPLYMSPEKYSHISRVRVNTAVMKRFMVGLLL